jgi:hypothetical protein
VAQTDDVTIRIKSSENASKFNCRNLRETATRNAKKRTREKE